MKVFNNFFIKLKGKIDNKRFILSNINTHTHIYNWRLSQKLFQFNNLSC